ncbi:MAG: hypothetical protein QOG66_3599 [Methylobacteriaceae bacterium]|jgi:hypothetical protein|nr:hypothetical protein [Methylobacteriaceae bacterium]
MRYTILASMTAAALAFAVAQASAQTKVPDTSTNVTTSGSEKMNPQGDLGAGVNGSASSQAHSAGQTSSGRSSAPGGDTNPSGTAR